jgi:hypothetical protein
MKKFELHQPVELNDQQKEAIERTIDLAYQYDGKYKGMTYEQGIREALGWILGDDENPLTEVFLLGGHTDESLLPDWDNYKLPR